MKFVKINPPGTFCTQEALRDLLKGQQAKTLGKTFLEVGCGNGDLSRMLCDAGLTGIGVDFSAQAIEIAKTALDPYLKDGRYQLHLGDIRDLPADAAKVDIAVSYMVMEHVEDDVGFIRKLSEFVKPGGMVILGVPGRRDRWSFEDETVGHFRRYDRGDLEATLEKADLRQVSVWSVGVPTINLLFNASLYMIKRSGAASHLAESKRQQTETSGIREIPWKTVFPSWVRIILNRTTLFPLFVLQRLFYRTGLGLVMMGVGRISENRPGAMLDQVAHDTQRHA
ncbi:class I SAM-dependent methyltransferase [Bradyrhizobium genosp. L]|uniref:class I SAM-dependent methyltransferase n=1 Tax=Bradyrhizobium genosp. L TaxID=83637 RepID=UPI0018A337E5|nr:class I SAM-dependent methyltransferase [Bradyrhizobium genosp. L]QPF83001.1 class I SAM-dependent methyltransferase [Bradyrhizobium genosp. L]